MRFRRHARPEILASAATNNGRVNTEWDAWFLEQIAGGTLESVLALTDTQIERDAGNGGHEIRTWIAAAAAWGAAIEVYGYEAQPAWLTGTACAAAFTT